MLLVADSFRVRAHDGRAEVRGYALHRARFAAAAAAAGADPAGVEAFLAAAGRGIAGFGIGFPRLELRGAPEPASKPELELRLALRPLPPLADTIALRTAPHDAPELAGLADPERKGPNLERYAALNRRLGAEAVRLDPAGRIVEGATTSIVWWEADALRVVADDARVPSVSERLLREAAAAHGVGVRRAPADPGSLAGREVWAVNALHGIRPATALDGAPLAEPAWSRLRAFRDALDRTWQAL